MTIKGNLEKVLFFKAARQLLLYISLTGLLYQNQLTDL